MATISEALAIAVQHHQGGRLQAAEQIYRQILRVEPNHSQAIHLLGVLAHQVGKHETAIDYLDRAIMLNGKEAAFHINLGEAYRALRRIPEAVDCYQRAIELKPDYAAAHHGLGIILKDQGKSEEAIVCYHRVLELDPNYAEAYNNLGALLTEMGRLEEAIVCYHRALERKQNLAVTYYNLGVALKANSQFDEAVASYHRALLLNPVYTDAYYNLGNILFDQRKLGEAISCFCRALELKPDFAEAQNNLGNVLQSQGILDEAIACFRRALHLKPAFVDALSNLGSALKEQGRHLEAASYFRHALALHPTVDVHSNLLLCLVYDPAHSLEFLHAEHVRWAEQYGPSPSMWLPHNNWPEPNRRLRIGYVSGDFRSHVVSCFIEPLLRCHNHERFEVYCYANHFLQDEVTQSLQRLSDHWRCVSGHSDAALEQLIRTDEIDILVDLSGHTARNRLMVFAKKPAPIQVTYVGYPATTGLKAIDYRLTDDILSPPGEPSYHVEQLYRLPCGSACFEPRMSCPEVAPLPALQRGYLTFGAPHNLAKLNAGVFDLWTRVLHQVPTARLVLFRDTLNGQAAQKIRDQFVERGIGEERFDLLCHATSTHGYRGYMAQYDDLDICLDTFPANAGATAYESLWMGVPWLTLYGDRFFSRQTASVLTGLGLSDWIARRSDELVAKAVFWSQHLEELAELRRGLRQRFSNSPLGNPAQFTPGLEAAYRDMWVRWCDNIVEPGK